MADVGDVIVFEFRAGTHSLTESTFGSPCKRLDGGVDSSILANPERADPGPKFKHVVTDEKPHFFHCVHKKHCGRGMYA